MSSSLSAQTPLTSGHDDGEGLVKPPTKMANGGFGAHLGVCGITLTAKSHLSDLSVWKFIVKQLKVFRNLTNLM